MQPRTANDNLCYILCMKLLPVLNCTVKIIIIFIGINKRVRCFESPTIDSVCLNQFNGLKTGFCLWPQMRISFGFTHNLHFTIAIIIT